MEGLLVGTYSYREAAHGNGVIDRRSIQRPAHGCLRQKKELLSIFAASIRAHGTRRDRYEIDPEAGSWPGEQCDDDVPVTDWPLVIPYDVPFIVVVSGLATGEQEDFCFCSYALLLFLLQFLFTAAKSSPRRRADLRALRR